MLKVSVLPVQVAGFDGPCEHGPVGAQLCGDERGGLVRSLSRRQPEGANMQSYPGAISILNSFAF